MGNERVNELIGNVGIMMSAQVSHRPRSKCLVDKVSLFQLDHQSRSLPQHKDQLVIPPLARFAKLHVEMPEHPGQNRAYLGVREAVDTNLLADGSGGSGWLGVLAHVRPMQFRGPVENG